MDDGDEPKHATAPELSGKEVLLVEDSLEDRKKCAGWLIAAGARVEEVDRLDAARHAFFSRRWNVLVIDRLLPDGDAFEWLCTEQRRGTRIPPCVVVSGHLDEKMYRRVYEMGAVPLPKHYLIHPDVLIQTIGSALRIAGEPLPDRGYDAVLANPLLPRGALRKVGSEP